MSLLDNAVKAANPAIPISQIEPSAPPAKITSEYPCLMLRNASPMACVPVAQAVTNDVHTPRAPIFIEMFPATMFPIAIGTNNGATRVGPLSCILII